MSLLQNATKRKWQVMLILSLGLNLYLLFSHIPLRVGVGQEKRSPDKRYTANLLSYQNANILSSDHHLVQGEVRIYLSEKTYEDQLVSLVVCPAGVPGEVGYGVLKDPISWAPSSDNVTFSLPHMTISISPRKLE